MSEQERDFELVLMSTDALTDEEYTVLRNEIDTNNTYTRRLHARKSREDDRRAVEACPWKPGDEIQERRKRGQEFVGPRFCVLSVRSVGTSHTGEIRWEALVRKILKSGELGKSLFTKGWYWEDSLIVVGHRDLDTAQPEAGS